jgi:hypothetical protein
VACGTATVYARVKAFSKLLSDKGSVMNRLHKHQQAKYSRKKVISPNCDTRWCVLHEMAADVLDSQVAIKAMLGDIVSRGPSAEDCSGSMESELCWASLRQVVELGKPVAEAITQLQGDLPKLASLLPLFESRLRHARAWKALVSASLLKVSLCAFSRQN